MSLTDDIGNIYKWWKESSEMGNAKDRLMIRGAGLLWIPLYWLLFVACIIIGSESYNKFVLYTIILLGIGFLVLGVIFSIVEINRISILNRYEQYVEKFWKDFKEGQRSDFSKIESSLRNLNSFWIGRRLDDLEPNASRSYKELRDSIERFGNRYFPKE